MFSNGIYGGLEPGMDDKYFDMVERLHQALRPYADRITFIQGSSAFYYMGVIGVATAVCAVLLAIAAVLFIGDTNEVFYRSRMWYWGLLLVGVTGTFIPLIKRGKAGDYHANELPLNYLPH